MGLRRCVLHIGWHKTGTTALQHFLHANADALAEHGVHVPAFSANHSAFLPSAVLADEPPTYNETFVLPLRGHEAIDKRVAAQLVTDDVLSDEMLSSDSAGTFVLSAEDLCLLDRASIQRCHDLLSATFDRVDVVAYLRDHGSYAHSATQQLIRMGFHVDEVVAMAESGRAPIQVLEPLPHYGRRLGDWADVAGPEHLQLYSYDEIRASGRSLLIHFLVAVLGLDEPSLEAAATAHPRTNSSFSRTATHVLNRMNATTPLFVDGRPNPGFQFNRQRHLAGIEGPNANAPAELLRPVIAAAASDEVELADRLGASVPELAPVDRSPFDDSTDGGGTQADATVDQMADALARAISEALSGVARQKLFASMLRLRRPASRAAAERQIHLARFLMFDQHDLVSSAQWLLGADEPTLARTYVDKAARFSLRPPGYEEMVAKLAVEP